MLIHKRTLLFPLTSNAYTLFWYIFSDSCIISALWINQCFVTLSDCDIEIIQNIKI